MVFVEGQDGVTRGDIMKDPWIKENFAACILEALRSRLSLAHLEIPRGNMAEEAIENGDPYIAEATVDMNIADEDRKQRRRADIYEAQLKQDGRLKDRRLEEELLSEYTELESFAPDKDIFRAETVEAWEKLENI